MAEVKSNVKTDVPNTAITSSGISAGVTAIGIEQLTGAAPWPMPSKVGDLVNTDLLNALLVALPFVEDALSDNGYKPGAVSKALKTINDALKSAGAL